ncbi:MAG TPA: hypothetical protein VFE51_18825 [Verrucomicrobiae bacterium]|nr:hypothetical protein [Verrucomicrobiae bacterium]
MATRYPGTPRRLARSPVEVVVYEILLESGENALATSGATRHLHPDDTPI